MFGVAGWPELSSRYWDVRMRVMYVFSHVVHVTLLVRNPVVVALLVASFWELASATCQVVKLRCFGRRGPLHYVILSSTQLSV